MKKGARSRGRLSVPLDRELPVAAVRVAPLVHPTMAMMPVAAMVVVRTVRLGADRRTGRCANRGADGCTAPAADRSANARANRAADNGAAERIGIDRDYGS